MTFLSFFESTVFDAIGNCSRSNHALTLHDRPPSRYIPPPPMTDEQYAEREKRIQQGLLDLQKKYHRGRK